MSWGPLHAPTPALGGARGPDASNTAAELDHTRNELLLVATRDVRCASFLSLVHSKQPAQLRSVKPSMYHAISSRGAHNFSCRCSAFVFSADRCTNPLTAC